MKAKIESFYDRNRQLLHKIVPIDTPFNILAEVSSACDLRCNFCAHSSEKSLKQRNHIAKNMNMETFSLILEQMKEFPQRVKRLNMAGLGEPLINPLLPEMIKKAKESGVSRDVSMFTNAVNLTHKMSRGIIDGGLDIITIAVNGLNSDDYKRNCGVAIDYEKFVEQIAFLYNNKKNLRMNIKTVDLCIDSESDRDFFFNTFGNICDYINIETIAPYQSGVEYSVGKNVKNMNYIAKFPHITKGGRVCTLLFRWMAVSSQGKVIFCDSIVGFHFEEANINKIRLVDLWNGDIHKKLQLDMLRGVCDGHSMICKDCRIKNSCFQSEDNLDPYAEEIYKRITGG